MILAFDTETTGFPSASLPPGDKRQAHIVQVAALLAEDDGTERAVLNCLVAAAAPVQPGALAAHGLSDDLVQRSGLPERTALLLWHQLAAKADVLVAHNIAFDLQILQLGFQRLGRPDLFAAHAGKVRYCTKEAAAPVCDLPPTPAMRRAGRLHAKAPTLTECVRHFFGEELAGAHDALADTRGCARVYFHLRQLERARQAAGAAA